jgi:hypothetical protein
MVGEEGGNERSEVNTTVTIHLMKVAAGSWRQLYMLLLAHSDLCGTAVALQRRAVTSGRDRSCLDINELRISLHGSL